MSGVSGAGAKTDSTGNRSVALTLLLFKKRLAPLIQALGAMSGFDKSPGQIFVAALAVAPTFDFLIAQSSALDRKRVKSHY
jgi:hypothetical protein